MSGPFRLEVVRPFPSTSRRRVADYATADAAIAAGREAVATGATVMAIVTDRRFTLGDPVYVWRGTPDPYTPDDVTDTERVLLYPDAAARRIDAQRGDIVWGTDPHSRQWTSGGLRGTFTGKDHAFHLIERRNDGRHGFILYGRPVCGTETRSTRVDPPSGPYARCARCVAWLAARDVAPDPPESSPT